MIRFCVKCVAVVLTVVLLITFFDKAVITRILPREYQEQVELYSEIYHVDEALVYAVIFCESRFNPQATSIADAKGLMQITDETGWWAASRIEDLNPETIDLYDPDTNIAIGCWYLSWLDRKFKGEQSAYLAAYNAGHGKVGEWLEDEEKSPDGIVLTRIPFEETREYVRKVILVEKMYRFCYRL